MLVRDEYLERHLAGTRGLDVFVAEPVNVPFELYSKKFVSYRSVFEFMING